MPERASCPTTQFCALEIAGIRTTRVSQLIYSEFDEKFSLTGADSIEFLHMRTIFLGAPDKKKFHFNRSTIATCALSRACSLTRNLSLIT